MKISFVVAKSRNNVIGKDNKLPWQLPADLAHFKKITMGKPIIMGRKTFDSIGNPLPGRRNIIVSRDNSLQVEGCDVFHSVDDALDAVKTEVEVMIIGGANLFAQTLTHANRIYLTLIDADFEGDTFFPELNDEWKLVAEEKCLPDEKNRYPYKFLLYQRSL